MSSEAVKAGYKKTEIGVIPEDWEVKPIGDLIDLLTGFPFSSIQYSNSGTRLLRGSNIKRGNIDWSEEITEYWPQVTPELKRYLLLEGDLVISMDGSLVGRSYSRLTKKDTPSLLLQRVARIRSKKIDIGYLKQFVGSDNFVKYSDSVKTVTAIPHISPGDIKNYNIPFPPSIEEQNAIAEALSDNDDLIASLDKLIAKKKDIKQAAMQELLTGKRRLPGFGEGKGYKQTGVGMIPEDWEIKTLGDLFTFKNGLNKGKEYFGHGIPIVNYMDVYKNRGIHISDLKGRVSLNNNEINTYIVHRGDVFFTRTSETIEEVGISAVMLDEPQDTVFSGFVLRAHPKIDDILIEEFKKYCFSSRVIRKMIVSKSSYTTRALTNGRSLSLVSIPIPSLPEQTAIAEILSDMDDEIAELEQKRDKVEKIKEGMMQELLTGRIRLV